MIYMCNTCKQEAHPNECVTADLLNVFLADSRKALDELAVAFERACKEVN